MLGRTQVTLPFISAKDLKKQFTVSGHFYSMRMQSGPKVMFRSVLEIIRKQGPDGSGNPDAIFVMMNPGSSEPIKSELNEISNEWVPFGEKTCVPTKPDTTQYQIMRVMIHSGWDSVRVVNLSDLRQTKSGMFYEEYKRLENASGFLEHSIFSSRRELELSQALIRKKGAPIVCAWGINDHLNTLTARAMPKLQAAGGVMGLASEYGGGKFLHPLPRPHSEAVKWVSAFVHLVRNAS